MFIFAITSETTISCNVSSHTSFESSSSSGYQSTVGNSLPNDETPYKKSRRPKPHLWQQNVNHVKRLKGLEYKNRKKEIKFAKELRIMEKCGCRFSCEQHIDSNQQILLFHAFYKLGDTNKQKAYLNSLIVEKEVEKNDLGNVRIILLLFSFMKNSIKIYQNNVMI